MHVQLVEELYQASWRPTPLDQAPPFGATVPAAPQPSISVLTAALTAKPVTPKPAGAYRPPGARGLATPAIFKREDEGGAPRMPTGSGSATPPRGYNRSPNPPGSMGHANGATPSNGNGHYQNGNGGRRHVPGAAPKTPSTAPAPGAEGDKKPKKKGKKREKVPGEAGSGAVTPTGEASVRPSIDVSVVGTQTPGQGSVPPTPGAESLDPVAKKVRNLNKKVGIYFFGCRRCVVLMVMNLQLKAIDELKEKANRGERLEATQLKKMEGEAEIRKELSSLGITA